MPCLTNEQKAEKLESLRGPQEPRTITIYHEHGKITLDACYLEVRPTLHKQVLGKLRYLKKRKII